MPSGSVSYTHLDVYKRQLQTRPAFRLTGLGGTAHPFELGLHALDELRIALALGGHTGGLGFQIGGIVALIRIQMPAVDLANPFGHVVEEIAVVRCLLYTALPR